MAVTIVVDATLNERPFESSSNCTQCKGANEMMVRLDERLSVHQAFGGSQEG